MTTETADDPSAVGRYGPFAIAVVTISLVAFPSAFNLGAFGQVFYDDIFRFVAAATAGFGVSLLASPYSGRRRWLVDAALGAPALWLLLASFLTDSTADAATDPILGPLVLVVAVVSIPTVLQMLIDMFVPGFRSYTDRRLLFARLNKIAKNEGPDDVNTRSFGSHRGRRHVRCPLALAVLRHLIPPPSVGGESTRA